MNIEELAKKKLQYTKEFKPEIKSIDEKNGTVTVYTNVAIKDRQGDLIEPKEFNLDNYKKNPVFLADHRYTIDHVLGKSVDAGVDDKGLWQTFKYFTDYEGTAGDLARWAFYLAQNGIAAFSIGFIPHGQEYDSKLKANLLKDVEILETSQVVVPANQDAVLQYAKSYTGKLPDEVQEITGKNDDEPQEKAVVPYKDLGIADVATKWDAAKEVAAADVKQLKQMCAWYDEKNPDVKSSYKLPHHRASDLKAVWKGVVAAMSALNGGRGGVDIPAGDRKAVYNHLVKHYEQFGMTPPDLKSDDEIAVLKRIQAIEDKAKEHEEMLARIERFMQDQIEINKRLSSSSTIVEKETEDIWKEVIEKIKKGE